jgi:hypothetical protein
MMIQIFDEDVALMRVMYHEDTVGCGESQHKNE